MNLLTAAFRKTASDLSRHGQAWALVGGFAVAARAEPRFTRDIDVAVGVDGDAEAEQLVRSLIGDGFHLAGSVEQEATGRLATVRLHCPVADEELVVVDLLFASSGIESEIAQAAEHLEILPGLTVPIATTGHLIALKLLASNDESRPLDLADLLALNAAATPQDLAVAWEAVRLISRRGFNRDRDLLAALDELVSRS